MDRSVDTLLALTYMMCGYIGRHMYAAADAAR